MKKLLATLLIDTPFFLVLALLVGAMLAFNAVEWLWFHFTRQWSDTPPAFASADEEVRQQVATRERMEAEQRRTYRRFGSDG